MLPWRSYRMLSDADVEALAVFLQSVPAVHHAVPGPAKLEDVKSPYLTVAMPKQ